MRVRRLPEPPLWVWSSKVFTPLDITLVKSQHMLLHFEGIYK